MSCLVEKLEYYFELSHRERELVATFEKEERTYARGAVITSTGAPITDIFAVKSGWLMSSTALPDGRRQLLKLHFPGDLVGLTETPLTAAPHEVQAVTDITICPYPKSQFDRVFQDEPRLAALFFSFAMVDHLVLLDRLRMLGRMSARERLGHFLLEILARLRITNRKMDTSFELPLTQNQIADAVGLTNVYVSKSLSNLRRDGLIAADNGKVTLVDEEALRTLCDFEDRYRSIDLSWMPPPKNG